MKLLIVRQGAQQFFHMLKNTCKVEAMQLSHIDNLERALALFMVVAWRVGYLMKFVALTCLPRSDGRIGLRDSTKWYA